MCGQKTTTINKQVAKSTELFFLLMKCEYQIVQPTKLENKATTFTMAAWLYLTCVIL